MPGFVHDAPAPLLKWPGGKTRELPGIRAAAPADFDRYLDPFVGGGSVLLSVSPEVPAAVNDACPELVSLYEQVPSELDELCALWDSLKLPSLWKAAADGDALRTILHNLQEWPFDRLERDVAAKLTRIDAYAANLGRSLSPEDLADNIEGAVRASFYLAVRERYNAARSAGRLDGQRVADFFVVRELCYASMFRFNTAGGFNVPYGGVSYNSRDLQAKVGHLRSPAVRARLEGTEVFGEDFETFLGKVSPAAQDLLFVDPPYDSEFSRYDDREFGHDDQRRLAAVLRELPCRTMVVIKDTPLVREVYDGWRMAVADKTYAWTIKSRNDRTAQHLTITSW